MDNGFQAAFIVALTPCHPCLQPRVVHNFQIGGGGGSGLHGKRSLVQHAVAEVVHSVAVADLGFGLDDEVGAGVAVDGDDAVACFERGLLGAAAGEHMADDGAVALLFGAAADVGGGRVGGELGYQFAQIAARCAVPAQFYAQRFQAAF